MTIQPCGCGSELRDWPYAHVDFDPEDTNGLHCGEDEDGNDLMWVYPDSSVGAFVATKSEAAGISGAGAWTDFGVMTERAGASYFNGTNIYTAPREGMYDLTMKAVPDCGDPEDFDIYFRIQSDYAAWATSAHGCPESRGDEGPFLMSHDHSVVFLGGAMTLTGVLPALDGGTFEFQVLQNLGSTKEFQDIWYSAFWKCPIPS